MTYFDRDHELRESALSCIFSAFDQAVKITLNNPCNVELQSGKTATILAVQRVDDESVLFLTDTGELSPMRIETNALMSLADNHILTSAFSKG